MSTILCVDDNQDLLDLYEMLFARENYQVTTACSGRDAIGILSKQSFDIVLSDIRMPNGTGIELLEYVQANLPSPKPHVVLITGYAEFTEEEVRRRGGKGLLVKPADVQGIVGRVRDLCRD
jgi:CheY-like chemotaxis protein